MAKNFDEMHDCFNTIPALGRRMDGQMCGQT